MTRSQKKKGAPRMARSSLCQYTRGVGTGLRSRADSSWNWGLALYGAYRASSGPMRRIMLAAGTFAPGPASTSTP